MTRDTSRPADSAIGYTDGDMSLLLGLWEQAPFARLPADAPAELRDLVENIDNPKRVYAVHIASRRHDFQLLVQKFVVQLRDGCGCPDCTTPTCFTCRKRLAGKAPIRRYNTTSARTLAVYLASQDNPERTLCPTSRQPKGPPAAMGTLLFVPAVKAQARDNKTSHNTKGHTARERRDSVKDKSSRPPATVSVGVSGQEKPTSPRPESRQEDGETSGINIAFTVKDRPVTKDYRSFAANMFGTVAFRMLEWLSPSGFEEMTRQTQQFRCDTAQNEEGHPVGEADGPTRKSLPSSKPLVDPKSTNTPDFQIVDSSVREAGANPSAMDEGGPAETLPTDSLSISPATNGQLVGASHEYTKGKEERVQQGQPPSTLRPGNSRRNSNAKVRKPSGPKTKRQLSVDSYAQEPIHEDSYSTLVRSPRAHSEKTLRPLKAAAGAMPRPISQLTTAGYFDDVSLERMPPPPPKSAEIRGPLSRSQLDGASSSGSNSPNNAAPKLTALSDASLPDQARDEDGVELEASLESFYPQALSRLNPQVVDLICDVLQEDGTAESHMLEPRAVDPSQVRQLGSNKRLRRRKSRQRRAYTPRLRLEWKLFVEQTLFYVLGDPHRVIRSFTRKGALYDSQTVWYCMLRLTRVAPTLVFHSLWVASAALFAPPQCLQKLRSPTAKLFPRQRASLSNEEAGCLLSICLHALVAAAPLVSDSTQLYDMSRIRSHGLSLAGSGAVARQPVDLCLQYDDAFSNDLALRLARRLFAAIMTRRCFDELNESNLGSTDEPDILTPLFSQLDLLNWTVYMLDFSVKDRALHETRVSTLLLDWARAVMIHDWSGSPEVPADGSFGGALALIDAMYQKRHTLLLGDTQFRSEYFAERLDAVQMPIGWLSHVGTKQKHHLLDFPYLFSPSSLVSYFRSINFSRMSRAYEESTSLEQRIDMIVNRASLVLNSRQKQVLTDMMSTATSKYLVLSVGRESVIQDTFDQLWRREEREILRPLKIHLGEEEGEEGFDFGGVQQEFFRLAVAEVLNPDYGAFTVDERTRMIWFQPGSTEELWKFELVGLLMSLAVYNGLTLPVTFPKALYRKLLGEPVTELHHITDGWRDLASGLTQLLEWDEKDGSVEDIFARTYEFSVEAFGEPVTQEMTSHPSPWPQPAPASTAGEPSSPPLARPKDSDDAPLVTSSNRNAYVYDYIRYLTDVSIRPQYEAFARGFRTCFHPKSLTLLTSNTLQSIVEGVQDIDVSELRRYARYIGPQGWDASHRTIRDFWAVVKKYDDRMKRRLLEFVTASDRLPVGGVQNLQFQIQKNGEEGEGGHLPTAYTCYGTLLLPEYDNREVLRERLAMALENAQGFGFA